eukprot:CAMPEP_0184865056 /NCGR_PEP_ID=MMETSP0580-20130426/16828_1 /TAXON_ID=1118495 /ORGANISM="Dactyliosolen fragilissimus" /LENGTH=666 /DNA_ID=CAMNT_0027364075 /DNA_START=29 /DNA_END=2029 /DNA_ORIENTATION=-
MVVTLETDDSNDTGNFSKNKEGEPRTKPKPSYYEGYKPRASILNWISGFDNESGNNESESNGGGDTPLETRNNARPNSFELMQTRNRSNTLDNTRGKIKGRGILASERDVRMPPEEFATGCKLLQAAALADNERIESLIKFFPDLINFRDYDRRTALHVAASEGNLSTVTLLVDTYKAPVNRSDRWGGSPLDDAHRHRHVEVAKFLRSRKGTTGNADYKVNFITAVVEGDLDEVAMLLGDDGIGNTTHYDGSIDINMGDYDKRAPLHIAAAHGNPDMVLFLCKRGANVNIEDQWGGTPIDDAARSGNQKCVNILKSYGASLNTKEVKHKSSLFHEKSLDSAHINDNLRTEFSELEKIDKIGAGAFGEIYKCKWRGTMVAAKCIKSSNIVREWHAYDGKNSSWSYKRSNMSETEKNEALEDFRKEISILSSLRHPNICMLLAYSQTEDYEVMISELMKCSLLDIFNANTVHNSHLSRRKQIVYAQQLTKGMTYLHSCKPPIIHRDLKPANLLIDFNGTLKISDFGLAKVRPDPKGAEMDKFTMTGETGSYRFMAPEVFRHENYNETVDVYSFAMILYYITSGRPPWPSLSGVKAVTKAAVDGNRPIVERSWDSQIVRLMQRCWDENPNVRPSFRKILNDLSNYSIDIFKMDADSIALEHNRCRCNIM